ncbi:MAG: hypothetical protein ACI9H6_000847, partial [Patiriisocius sp.]
TSVSGKSSAGLVYSSGYSANFYLSQRKILKARTPVRAFNLLVSSIFFDCNKGHQ